MIRRKHRNLRASAVPLLLPRPDVVPTPDVDLLLRYDRELTAIWHTAHTLRDQLDPQRGSTLARELVDHWWPAGAGRPEHVETRVVPVITSYVRLGIATAEAERQEEDVQSGFSHPLIATTVASGCLDVPREYAEVDRNLRWRAAYAYRAGYYEGRVGETSIPELVENAGRAS